MDTGGIGERAECHSRVYLGSGKGVAATGIRQACQEQGRVGGGYHGQRRVDARPVTLVCWDRYR